MIITKEEFEFYKQHEWLITNGIGGFASSTLCGLNTRKYHGYLIAAVGETRERKLILSKINEAIQIGDHFYTLSTNECPNYREEGYVWQESFEKELLPTFSYQVQDVQVKKKLALVHGENTVCVKYEIKTGKDKIRFSLTPLFNHRNFHEINLFPYFSQAYSEDAVRIDLGDHLKCYMTCEGEYIEYENTFYENMYYEEENKRGLEDKENHYIPGRYEINIPAHTERTIFFYVSLDQKRKNESLGNLLRQEEVRLEKICKIANAKSNVEKTLAIAADQFIIEKQGGKTIIAGYPWFSDWGRDTFIALEGLTLKTNRFTDAKSILLQFSKYIQNGLVPNVISENGGESYNSVDSSLWYIEAVYQYMRYTKDKELLENVYPKLQEIIECYQKGTGENIYMDQDGLIVAGNEKTQLTWMDAKIGDIVPTPRNGKAVEINALWYNALKIMEYFSDVLSLNFDKTLSEKVKQSFEKFYAEEGLLDTIEPSRNEIRPNQILAIGLSYPVVTGDKAREILDLVTRKLWTSKGLKTLSSDDPKYVGTYEGDVYHRDMAYHQGTVWPWLYGPYRKAYENCKREKWRIENVEELLTDDCIGSIAEIYDADEPRKAKGAFAQAWSVASVMNNE